MVGEEKIQSQLGSGYKQLVVVASNKSTKRCGRVGRLPSPDGPHAFTGNKTARAGQSRTKQGRTGQGSICEWARALEMGRWWGGACRARPAVGRCCCGSESEWAVPQTYQKSRGAGTRQCALLR